MQNVCEARIGYFYQQLSLGRKIAKIKRMNKWQIKPHLSQPVASVVNALQS